jgi:hypothetical protein
MEFNGEKKKKKFHGIYKLHGPPWTSVDLHGHPWKYGLPWTSMDFP